MSTGELRFEAMRHRVIDDLRREYNQLWMQSIDGETQSERDWYAAKCEGYEEAIADIAMGLLQMPLTLRELRGMKVVWLEDIDKEDVIPALVIYNKIEEIINGIRYPEAFVFRTFERCDVLVDVKDYGKRWRAWAYEPTSEERERAWEVANESVV